MRGTCVGPPWALSWHVETWWARTCALDPLFSVPVVKKVTFKATHIPRQDTQTQTTKSDDDDDDDDGDDDPMVMTMVDPCFQGSE